MPFHVGRLLEREMPARRPPAHEREPLVQPGVPYPPENRATEEQKMYGRLNPMARAEMISRLDERILKKLDQAPQPYYRDPHQMREEYEQRMRIYRREYDRRRRMGIDTDDLERPRKHPQLIEIERTLRASRRHVDRLKEKYGAKYYEAHKYDSGSDAMYLTEPEWDGGEDRTEHLFPIGYRRYEEVATPVRRAQPLPVPEELEEFEDELGVYEAL